MSETTRLFSKFRLRDVEFPNRVLISPMSQYSAIEGMVQDWHRDHIASLAKGGAGSVMVEASAVTRDGRGTPGDLGIWSSEHVPGLRELASTIARHGGVPAIQIGHAGRKASCQRPWEGNGPLALSDAQAWQPVAASAIPVTPAHAVPQPLSVAHIDALVAQFRDAATRAVDAGFSLIEIHAAHGYLLHGFLSPLANQRQDQYGGTLGNRMRFPLCVLEAVRDAIGDRIALSVRVSAVDGLEGGWQLDDTIAFARAAKDRGVDIIDCSSGGIAGAATASASPNAVKRGPGFQVPFAEAVKHAVPMPTIAVGLIVDPSQAERVLASNRADLVAIGRQALVDPNWALNARHALGLDPDFEAWPAQSGWWLKRRPRLTLEPD